MPNHNGTALIIRCMDKRLPKKIVEYLEEKGLLGHCYDPARAGAINGLLNDTDPAIWNDIEIGVTKGGVGQIILCNHTDCAAYGGSSRFSSFKEECGFHTREMEKAKELILAKYPDLKIQLVLAKIESSGEVDFESVD